MANIKIRGFYCADHFILDNNSKISIIGIFQNINTSLLPTTHPKIVVIGLLDIMDSNPGESFDVKLTLKDPKGTLVGEFNLNGQQGDARGANVIIELINQKFELEGKYEFILYVNFEEVEKTHIQVIKTK